MGHSATVGIGIQPPFLIPVVGLAAGAATVIHEVVSPGQEDVLNAKLSPGGRNLYIRAKGMRLVAPSPGGGFRLGRISLFTRYTDGGPRTELARVALTDREYIYGPFPTPAGFWEIEVTNEGGTNAITFDLEIWYSDEPVANPANILNNVWRDIIQFSIDSGAFEAVRTYSVGSLSWGRPENDAVALGFDVEAIDYLCTPGPWVGWKFNRILGAPLPPNLNWRWIGRVEVAEDHVWFLHGAGPESPPAFVDPFDFHCPFPIMEFQVQRLQAGTVLVNGCMSWLRKT